MKNKPLFDIKREQKKPISPELQAIIGRGSDGCFTAKEAGTFDQLDTFIRDGNNTMRERAIACYVYDSMMVDPIETEQQLSKRGPEAVVKKFIKDLDEGLE